MLHEPKTISERNNVSLGLKRGILFIGSFPSRLGSRGISEALSEELTDAGFHVIVTSRANDRFSRLSDMIITTWKKRHSYSIAHVDVYSGYAFSWAEMICAMLRLLKKPYVLTLHGGNLPLFAKTWSSRVSSLLKSATAVTTPSRYLKEELIKQREDTILIPNPVELNKYHFRVRSPAAPILGWLRSFHAIYNPLLALHVVDLLRAEYPEIKLFMIGQDKGDGTYEKVMDLVANKNLHQNVVVVGPIKKDDVPAWLDKMDIFINTTNVDNTPVSVIEAMACGLCIVSTNVGGIPFLLNHEQDAILVDPDKPDMMAEAIRRILKDHSLSMNLSEHAHKRACEFDLTNIINRWIALFIDTVDKRSPKSTIYRND